MPKFNDLPNHPDADITNDDLLAVSHQIPAGGRESRKLTLRVFGEWLLKIGAKITGATTNSILAIDANGDLQCIKGVTYDAGSGAIVLGEGNTSQPLPSIKIRKNINPLYPGKVLEVENVSSSAAFSEYFVIHNDGSVQITDDLLISKHVDGSNPIKNGISFSSFSANAAGAPLSFTLKHYGTMNHAVYPGMPNAEIINALTETQQVLRQMGLIDMP